MEEFSMARQSKREYLQSIYKRYRQGGRTEKTAMLEEFCKVCGYNRKYAIWLLSRPLPKAAAKRRVTVRSVTYSRASITMLAKVWQASGYLCSQRLKAALPQWLPWIKKHFELNGKLEKELLAILRGLPEDVAEKIKATAQKTADDYRTKAQALATLEANKSTILNVIDKLIADEVQRVNRTMPPSGTRTHQRF